MAKCNGITKGSKMQRLIGSAISDAIHTALLAKPVKLFYGDSSKNVFILEDGNCYTAEAAIQKIGGQYSWWADAPKV